MKKIAALALCLLAGGSIRAEPSRVFAITGARIITTPGQVIEPGTIVLRDGLIEAVGRGITPPADAYVIDAAGKIVTAGFIDSCTDLGQKKIEPAGGAATGPTAGAREAPAGPVHPIARIHPEKRAIDLLVTDAAAFEKHRGMGFTTVVTMPAEGIFRGKAAIIDLGAGPAPRSIVQAEAGQVIAFERGGFGQGYPASLMGAIAAIRQTLLDAQRQSVWAARYQAGPVGMPRPEYLSAFGPLAEVTAGRTPVIFDLKESADVARAIAISREFNLKAILIGSGAESMEPGGLSGLKKSGYPVILPLAYPDKPKVDDPDEALNVTLQTLERWDAAPSNPARLSQAGIAFALGTCRLPAPGDFSANLRKAIAQGLTAEAALTALTTAPARFFGVEKSLGTIDPGKIANLVVFDGAAPDGEGVFTEKSKPALVFVDGIKYEVEQRKTKGDPSAKVDPRGTWSIVLTIGNRTMNRTWTIDGKEGDYSGTAETQSGVVDFASVKLAGNEMTVVLPAQAGRQSQEIIVVITGDSLEGSGEFGGGASYSVKGTRTSPPEGGAL